MLVQDSCHKKVHIIEEKVFFQRDMLEETEQPKETYFQLHQRESQVELSEWKWPMADQWSEGNQEACVGWSRKNVGRNKGGNPSKEECAMITNLSRRSRLKFNWRSSFLHHILNCVSVHYFLIIIFSSWQQNVPSNYYTISFREHVSGNGLYVKIYTFYFLKDIFTLPSSTYEIQYIVQSFSNLYMSPHYIFFIK